MVGDATGASRSVIMATMTSAPDYFGPGVAEQYDDPDDPMFSAEVLDPTVDLLAGLAGDGGALELAIGTGRVAIPLARRGIHVKVSICRRQWSSSCESSRVANPFLRSSAT